MPLPSSVTKLKIKNGKSELTFISSVDRVNYTMDELIRRANMDVGKYLTRLIRYAIRQDKRILAKAKYAPQRYQYWARKQENDLQIGVENTSKGAETAWFADQWELGTNNQPKKAFIYNTVRDHISDIRDIQAQYISAIEDEQRAIALAAEAESAADEVDEMDGE